MTIVIGAIAGLAFGCIIGCLKNCFLWLRYLKKTNNTEGSADAGVKGAYIRSMISYAVNFLALLVAFVLRDVVPFDGMAFLIGTAVGLSVMNKMLTVEQKRCEEKGGR